MINRTDTSSLPRQVRKFAQPRSLWAIGALSLAATGFAAPLAVVNGATAAVERSLPEIGIDAGPRLDVGNAAAYGVSGTCSENLQAVSLSIRHDASGRIVEAPSVPCAGGVWQIAGVDLSGLGDGPLTIQARHDDLAGNRVELLASLVKGGIVPRVGIDAPALIHPGNLDAYALSGSCSEEGRQIALMLRDAAGHSVSVSGSAQPVCSGQRWSVVLSGLALIDDGVVTATVTHRAIGFETATLSTQVVKNVALPGLSIDPLLFVKTANQAAFPVSGTCSEAQQPVFLSVSDSSKVTVYGTTLCSGKSWSLPTLDLSSLAGGELRFVATHANAAPVVRTVLQAGLKDSGATTVGGTIAGSTLSPTAGQAAGSARTKGQTLLQAQTITFNRLTNKTLGDLPFTVSATASSGLPVAFSSLTPQVCTTTGNQGSTVSLLLLGTCTLQANQAGNDQYSAALPVDQGFTVGAQAQGDTFSQASVAAGANHTLVVHQDGSVWVWGDNDRGQLGDSTRIMRSTPVQVSGLSALQVGAGAGHSAALRADRAVVSWGANEFGQLGDGTTTDRSAPVTLAGSIPTAFSAIAVGAYHTLAVAGGEVWAWGANGDGQIGQATTTPYNATPAKIAGLTGIVAVAAGANHSLALKSDGTVWAWGRNSQGQLGNNTATASAVPVQVLASVGNPLTGVTAIAAGGEHSLALKNGGILAWGSDWAGQLGNGASSGDVLMPGAVTGLTADVKAIGAGNAYSLALKTDGTVMAWGYGAAGQIGNGSTGANETPVAVAGVDSVMALAAGENHAVALKSDGALLAWGYNGRGQLGEGKLTFRQEPVNPGESGVTSIAAGAYHLLTNTGAASAKGWGSNWRGQLADGAVSFRAFPTDAAAVFSATGTTVASGFGHTLTRQGGVAQAVGGNWTGQLGNGSTTQSSAPVAVAGGLTGLKGLAAGGQHSLAIKSDDSVAAWGANDAGQLGNNSLLDSTSPVNVNAALSGVVSAVVAGYAHSVALKSDGSVWTWGNNLFGQLGDSGTTNRSIPAQVSSFGVATQIAAGMYHTLALAGGEIWAWGSNSAGQLGDGSTTDRPSPVKVSGLSGITKIAAGSHHTLAMNGSGNVWVWGRNDYGQLGDASTTASRFPLLLANVTAADIAAGAGYSMIRTTDGELRIMGDGRDGELGLGSTANAAAIRPTPTGAMINLYSGPAVRLSPVPSLPTTTSPSFTATSSVAGKAYWVLVRSTQRAPTFAQIKTGSGDVNYAVVSAGNGDVPAGGSGLAINPTGLAAGQAYRLFACVANPSTDPCSGNAVSVDFMTAKAGGATYTLDVAVAGTSGAGFVTTNTEGNDGTAMYCASGSCSETYPTGQTVTLRAYTNTAATFTGWTGTGCSGTSTTCTVSATANVTATFNRTDVGGVAQFQAASYSATVGKPITITITRTGNIDAAASVNIGIAGGTAVPADYTLSANSVSFAAGQASASFTITANAGSNGKTVQLSLSAGSGSPTIGTNGNITVNLRKSAGTPWLMLLLD